MSTIIEQVEAVSTAFAASDKGFEPLEAAWVEVARIAPQVDPDDEDASLALLRFIRCDLAHVGRWPTAAQRALGAVLPIIKRWQDLYNADFNVDLAEARRREAVKKARWNSAEANHERKLQAARSDVRYARERLVTAQKEFFEKERNLQDLQSAQDVQH